MPSWMKDEGKWADAKAAARKQYPDLSEDDDKFWAITTSIYKKMGGRIAAAKGFTLTFRKSRVRGHTRGSSRERIFTARRIGR